VLVVWLGSLSSAWVDVAWVLVGCIAGFTLRYSVTAISALTDPQPGSSMSGTAGTSFTL